MDMKLLLVDDEGPMRDLLRRMVEEMGHEPLLARNGEEALRVLRTEKVDVMVTDLVMPVMDGWVLAEQVKEAYPDVPIVGISGRVEPLTEESPFDRFMDKPFSLQAFTKEIEELTGEETRRTSQTRPLPRKHRIRICLVGEESIVTKILCDFLSDLGHRVVRVHPACELPDHLASQTEDLVIMDLHGPGDTVLLRKMHQEYPHVAVVLMTVGSPPLSREETLSCGVYAYLHKPISLAELELLLVRLSERPAERV